MPTSDGDTRPLDSSPVAADPRISLKAELDGADPLRAPIANEGATLTYDATESPVGHRHPAEDTATTAPAPRHIQLPAPRRGPDRVFRGLASGAGFLIVAMIAAIAIFLLMQAIPSLAKNEANFLTSNEWTVADNRLAFGIAGMLWTTSISSIIAMILAVPIAVGVALLITHYSSRRVGNTVGFLVDLLAAVPSVVYGLWGARVLGPALAPFTGWIQDNLGWFPLLSRGLSSTGTVFIASLVLAIMILPIVTSISRDVFRQTPRDHIEAAYALGSTKWEMIKTAVLPYGRSGVIAASMLGLGRALGETIAVMLILSTTNDTKIDFSLFAGGQTFAAKIANNAAEFDSATKTGAYIAAGLVLFILTFVVNALARIIADRGKAK